MSDIIEYRVPGFGVVSSVRRGAEITLTKKVVQRWARDPAARKRDLAHLQRVAGNEGDNRLRVYGPSVDGDFPLLADVQTIHG